MAEKCKEVREVNVAVLVPKDLHEKLLEYSEKEERTLSWIGYRALQDWVAKQGV